MLEFKKVKVENCHEHIWYWVDGKRVNPYSLIGKKVVKFPENTEEEVDVYLYETDAYVSEHGKGYSVRQKHVVFDMIVNGVTVTIPLHRVRVKLDKNDLKGE